MILEPILGFIDMPGPAFVGLYVGLMVVAGFVAAYFQSKSLKSLDAKVRRVAVTEVDVETLACVRDGVRGLVATVLATLVHRGHVEIVAQGSVRAIDRPLGEVAGEAPLGKAEAKVLARLQTKRSLNPEDPTLTTRELQGDLSLHYAELEAAAIARGLIMAPDEHLRLTLAGFWPWLIVIVVGFIKMGVGLERDRPVGFLLLLIVASGFLMLLFRAPSILPGAASLLARLSEGLAPLKEAALRSPEMLTTREIAFAAAVLGVGQLGGGFSGLNDAVAISAGSSCSSSSSCGGGCGGCGGCS